MSNSSTLRPRVACHLPRIKPQTQMSEDCRPHTDTQIHKTLGRNQAIGAGSLRGAAGASGGAVGVSLPFSREDETHMPGRSVTNHRRHLDGSAELKPSRSWSCDTRHAHVPERHATRDTRHATRDTHTCLSDTRHATRDTRHATSDTQHATRNTQHAHVPERQADARQTDRGFSPARTSARAQTDLDRQILTDRS